MENKTDIKSLLFDELGAFLKELGEPAYRAEQIFAWLHKGVTSFDEMTNLSKAVREKLSEKAYITVPLIEKKLVSAIDGTVKYLWKLQDGECVESVVMQYNHGYSICVSSEVGCRMGCAFCASTIGGLKRFLAASEILDQVIFAQKDMGIRISSIVMMGIGEPLDNFDNTVKFLYNVNHEKGINIGYRHISLSTCGIVNRIDDLAGLNLPITLSVSLHAPNDKIRSELMPVNRKWSVDELISACKRYVSKTKRRISFEYTLIDGLNDTARCAGELSDKLRGMLCHINLIPVNEVKERKFIKSGQKKVNDFKNELERRGMTVTVRRKLGSDINASCGQLRRQRLDENGGT